LVKIIPLEIFGYKTVVKQSFLAPFMIFTLLFMDFRLSAQETIPDSVVKVRIDYIRKMLDEGKPAAKLWWNAWLYGYSAATVGQGIVFLTNDDLKTRQDMALGAATSLIGAAGQLLMPMVPAYAPEKLSLIPGETPEQRLNKLKQAEEIFEASAKRELDGRSWKMHAADGIVNLGSGLVTWLGFKRTVWAGLGNFALNTAICEVQIFTQPTRAIKDYKKYREQYVSGLPQAYQKQDLHLSVNSFPGGITMRFYF